MGCGKNFNHLGNFNYHKKHECGRLFACPICGTVLKKKSTLKVHMGTQHSDRTLDLLKLFSLS
jgi:hypothetical protein